MLLLLACNVPADPEPVPVRERLERAGWFVGEGELAPFDLTVCCEDARCLGNNPSTPYLSWILPPAPGQAPEVFPDGVLPLLFQTGTDDSRVFHLREDEVVLQLGRTPPPAAYFSWRSYLGLRTYDALPLPQPVLGSLGPSLNQVVVGAAGVGPDEDLAIVTSTDAAAEREVIDLLVASGWDRARVFADRISLSIVDAGMEPDDDAFTSLFRAAVFDDPEAGAAYLADPPFTVWRLTPDRPATRARERHPLEAVPVQGSGTSEAALAPGVDALADAIRAYFPDRVGLEATAVPRIEETYDCIAQGRCAFDTNDRYESGVVPALLPDDGTLLVGFGVNHASSGKATYANVAVFSEETAMGVAVVESPEFPGTARPFLPDDARADDYYAVAFARDCSPWPELRCVEVPAGCPGIELDHHATVRFRAYLEPSTGAAPLPEEIVADRAMYVSRSLEP